MHNMQWGLGAAITWALDTVILSIALSSAVFMSTAEAIALASFTSTFLHDFMCSIYMFIFNGATKRLKQTAALLKTKSGKLILLAGCIGGPIGMSGYVFAVSQIGAAYTTAISAFFPAFGAALANFVLKERLKPYQWFGLGICLIAVAVLGFNPDESVPGNWVLGVGAALLTVVGWGSEGCIVSYALHFGQADEKCCLQIRYTISAIVYAILILPILGAWPYTVTAMTSNAMPIVALAALSGTTSYIFYYTSIGKIGTAKSMALDVTYSAWAVPLSLLLLGTIPTTLGIVCAVFIIVGAIICATDVKELFGNKKSAYDLPEGNDRLVK